MLPNLKIFKIQTKLFFQSNKLDDAWVEVYVLKQEVSDLKERLKKTTKKGSPDTIVPISP